MKKPLDPRKLINILFIVVVALLIINLLLDKIFPGNKIYDSAELSASEIDSTFKLALNNVGIQNDWIKERNKNKLSVNIPNDLPIALILLEINNVFDTNGVKIKSIEKKIGGSTALNFISGGEEKLIADLKYSDKVKRKNVRVGFLLKKIAWESEAYSSLLQFPEQFAFMIIPSKASSEFVKNVLKNGKEYFVYLSDDLTDLKYKLSSSYSETRLKNSVREIVGAFPQAVFFIVDNNSSIYKSEVYSLLKEEMGKRKIKLIEESYFRNLSDQGENNSEIFNNALGNLNAGEDKAFIISAEDFLSLNSEIMKYRKLGYKFTNPSALLYTGQ